MGNRTYEVRISILNTALEYTDILDGIQSNHDISVSSFLLYWQQYNFS